MYKMKKLQDNRPQGIKETVMKTIVEENMTESTEGPVEFSSGGGVRVLPPTEWWIQPDQQEWRPGPSWNVPSSSTVSGRAAVMLRERQRETKEPAEGHDRWSHYQQQAGRTAQISWKLIPPTEQEKRKWQPGEESAPQGLGKPPRQFFTPRGKCEYQVDLPRNQGTQQAQQSRGVKTWTRQGPPPLNLLPYENSNFYEGVEISSVGVNASTTTPDRRCESNMATGDRKSGV